MAEKKAESPLMCQNFTLSRFAGNVNCSSVWCASHCIVWQLPLLRLAEALSIDCDAQRHSVSTPHVWSEDHCHSVTNTKHDYETDSWFYRTFMANDLLNWEFLLTWLLKAKWLAGSSVIHLTPSGFQSVSSVSLHISTQAYTFHKEACETFTVQRAAGLLEISIRARNRSDNTLLMPLRIIASRCKSVDGAYFKKTTFVAFLVISN